MKPKKKKLHESLLFNQWLRNSDIYMECKISRELNKADVNVNESNIHNLYIILYINVSTVYKGSLILVLGSQWTPKITGSAFRISLQHYW